MKEIIRVQQAVVSGEKIKTVNARELHSFLENKDHFATWIKDRIAQFDFTENQDFVTYSESSEKGRPAVEYALTLGMAKELSMVERNAKGKQARQYFIECERVAQNPIAVLNDPAAMRGLLLSYTEKVLELEAENKKVTAESKAARRQIEQDSHKVEFAEKISDAKDGIEVGLFAKVTFDKFGVGRNGFFAILRNAKVLIPDTTTPYQKYIDAGWFTIKESTYWNKKYEKDVPYTKTLITGKGQVAIFKLLSEHTSKAVANA